MDIDQNILTALAHLQQAVNKGANTEVVSTSSFNRTKKLLERRRYVLINGGSKKNIEIKKA